MKRKSVIIPLILIAVLLMNSHISFASEYQQQKWRLKMP